MASKDMVEGLKGLFVSGYFSDLVIVCGERNWKAHRSIVCTQSDFFMKACTGKFKEATERKIDLGDDNPDAVPAMLQYLYKREYSNDDAVAAGTPVALLHVRVYNLADKYDIASLKDHTLARFKLIADKHWKEQAFAKMLPEIVNDGPESSLLRQCVINIFKNNASQLCQSLLLI
ncbi:hypothetical protein LTR36_003137 [Oleoguttula mirabilis]|uniref:BTB domain-containing protein n=1 Tax=Oleoguttula mirabilis TaxID=1507867 RepID=A0AAV9JX87_9PEZI|nr:hypothetical protein LTR36_003137 [Oleoguttula mirabilis]